MDASSIPSCSLSAKVPEKATEGDPGAWAMKPIERPEGSSTFLSLAWLNPHHCKHLESETVDG